MLVLDTMHGRFKGDFKVKMDGGELVFRFTPSKADAGCGCEDVGGLTSSGKRKSGFVSDASGFGKAADHDFLKLANLVSPIEKLEFNSGRIEIDDIPLPSRDIKYEYAPADELVAVASEIGPLFGHACVVEGKDVIREPVRAWLDVARVMNFAVRAESVTDRRARVDTRILDGDVAYGLFEAAEGMYLKRAQIFTAAKSFGPYVSEPYANMLDVPSELLEPISRPIAVDDGALYGRWLAAPAFSVIANAEFRTRKRKPQALAFPADALHEMDEEQTDFENGLSMAQTLAEIMVQQLVAVHLCRTHIGWGVVHDEKAGRDVGAIGIQFNNRLEALWHSLGLRHSGGKLGVCKRCGKLFSADNERKSTKIYCSKSCQESAKDERSKARRKRQRAEAKKH